MLSVGVRVFILLQLSTTLALVCFFYFFHETFQNNIVLEGSDFERKSFTRGFAELQNTDWKTYGDFLWTVT